MCTKVLLSTEGWTGQFWKAFKEKMAESVAVGDIGEKIRESILQRQYRFSIGGVHILLTDAILAMWFAVVILAVLSFWLGRKREWEPKGRQVVSETIVGLFSNLCRSNGMNQKQTEIVVPYVGSICLFLFLCNIVSVFRIPPPTKNLAFPFGLAFFTMISVIVLSIRFVGVRGFFHSLIYPMKYIVPFILLDYLIKPVSLALRLFGNIFGAYILIEFVYILVPAVLPWVLGLWFDIGDGLLQAVVFAYLTTSYIGEIIEGAEKYEESRKDTKKVPAEII